MVVDPAFRKASLPEGTINLDALQVHDNAVYVFDFDGVVIGSTENDLYRLAEGEGENDLLARTASLLGLCIEPMDIHYRRHILYQAAAHKLGLDMAKGPAFDLYATLARQGRAFLLTARSNYYACERVMSFFRSHECPPLETYFVGRGGKDIPLQILCREYAPQKVYFIDDSASHLVSAAQLGLENLRLVHAPRSVPAEPEEVLRDHFLSVINGAFSLV